MIELNKKILKIKTKLNAELLILDNVFKAYASSHPSFDVNKPIKKKKSKAEKESKQPNDKQLCILLDHFLNQSQARGCFCYLLTINFTPEDIISTDENIFQRFQLLISGLKDIAFYTLALEHGENEIYKRDPRPHVHAFIAIENLIGNNSRIKDNLKNIFTTEELIDTKIDECKEFIDKAKAIKYVLKEVFDEPEVFVDEQEIFVNKQEQSRHVFVVNSNWMDLAGHLTKYLENIKKYGKRLNITMLEVKKKTIFKPIEPNENTKNLSLNNIINLFKIYFEEKRWYVNEFNLYESIENTHLSVRIIQKTENVEKLYEELKECLINKHPSTLYGFDFDGLKSKCMKLFIKHFTEYPATIGQYIQLSFNLMEFTDGIYVISTDTFIQCKDYENLETKTAFTIKTLKGKGIKTISYYNRTYHHRKRPKIWINHVLDRFGGDKERALDFFVSYAKFFNEELVKTAGKSALTTLVIGPPNTLKSTLVIKPIQLFYTMEYLGTMGKSDTFTWDDFVTGLKHVIVCEEFELDPKKANEWLKVASGDATGKVDRKHKSAGILTRKPIVATTNTWEIQRSRLLGPTLTAIEKRTTIFEYTEPVDWSPEKYQKLIKYITKNLPDIIIYINKLAKRHKKRNIQTIYDATKKAVIDSGGGDYSRYT